MDIILLVGLALMFIGSSGFIIMQISIRNDEKKQSRRKDNDEIYNWCSQKPKKNVHEGVKLYVKIVRAAYKIRGEMTEYEVLRVIHDLERILTDGKYQSLADEGGYLIDKSGDDADCIDD